MGRGGKDSRVHSQQCLGPLLAYLPCVLSAPHPGYLQGEPPESGRSELSVWCSETRCPCAQDLVGPGSFTTFSISPASWSLGTPLSIPSSRSQASQAVAQKSLGDGGVRCGREGSLPLVVVAWEMFTRSQGRPLPTTEYRHSLTTRAKPGLTSLHQHSYPTSTRQTQTHICRGSSPNNPSGVDPTQPHQDTTE